jgi:pyruvate ferredoxin oxidoreductase gamma subunit/2-oxoisovalerate ferredoxin oxidoreductase gamma subunit
MIEIRIHGRGGQGAVIASQILAQAAFRDSMHVQAFPAFGSERRGAPVTAFLRLDRSPIRVRCEVYRPDGLIVLDESLIGLPSAGIIKGLKDGGWILINSAKDPAAFAGLEKFTVATVDASGIGRRNKLGTPTAPLVNTAIVGAFAQFTGLATLDNLAEAIRSSVPVKANENVAAALAGLQSVSTPRLGEAPTQETRRHAHVAD